METNKLQQYLDGFAHYFPEGVIFQSDGPFLDWENKKGFIEEIKGLTGLDVTTGKQAVIKEAQQKLMTLVDQSSVEAESTTPDQGVRDIQEKERIERAEAATKAEAKGIAEVEKFLENKKAYIKLHEKKNRLSSEKKAALESLKTAAKENPQEAAEQLTGVIKERIALSTPPEILDILAKQTSIDVITSLNPNINSPVVLNAIQIKISESPKILKRIIQNPEAEKALEGAAYDLASFSTTQLELSKKVFGAAFGNDAAQAIFNSPEVEISAHESSGSGAYPLSQISESYLQMRGDQNSLTESIISAGSDKVASHLKTYLGDILTNRIANLPTGNALKSEFISNTLSVFGLGAPVNWVAAEGSGVLVKFAVSGGYGPLLGTVQNLTGWNLGVVKKAGGAVVKSITQTAGSAAVKKGASGVVSKIITGLGAAASWTSAGISLVGGYLLGKIIEKIPWDKVKNAAPYMVSGAVGGILFTTVGPVVGVVGGLGTLALFNGLSLASLGMGLLGFMKIIGKITIIEIATPIIITLITLPVIVTLIIFIINSGAFIVPPSLSSQKSKNLYVEVTKEATPTGPFENSDLPLNITYNITVRAKKGVLTNIRFEHTCKVVKEGTQTNCPAPIPVVPTSISPSSDFVFTYQANYSGATYQDSLVLNTFSVTADAAEKGNQKTSGSATTIIGKPPTQCLKIDGIWPGEFKSNMEYAVSTLSSNYSGYVAKVCSAFPNGLSLKYNPSGKGGLWGFNNRTSIEFFSLGLGSEGDALYILAHELGHSLIWSIGGIWSSYLATPGINSETPTCFYSYGGDINERLPEAIAYYVIGSRCGSVQQKYPIHYRYLLKYVFN